MASRWFLLCGFSYPRVCFTVAISGYISAMEFLFSSERHPKHFRNISFVFCTPEKLLFHDRTGPTGTSEPIPLVQHDQNTHLILARIAIGDLDNTFALIKLQMQF